MAQDYVTRYQGSDFDEQLIKSARWFFYAVKFETRQAAFLEFPSKRRYAQFPFHFPAAVVPALPVCYDVRMCRWETLLDRMDESVNTSQYLFHMALGGSSLVCRCLEALGNTIVIKEATPLGEIYQQRQFASSGEGYQRWQRDLRCIHQLNSRTFLPEDTVINKPHIMANALMRSLLSIDHATHATFLHQSPGHFCLSRLNTPARRAASRSDLAVQQRALRTFEPRCDLMDLHALVTTRPEGLSDAIVAAISWLIHLAWPLSLRGTSLWEQLRFLDAETVFDHPVNSLLSLCDFFGVAIADRTQAEKWWWRCLESDSKNQGQPYSQKARIQSQRQHLDRYKKEIVENMAFLRSVSNLNGILDSLLSQRLV